MSTDKFMIKDCKKYGATDGWGCAQFDDAKPADEAMHSLHYIRRGSAQKENA